jgi:hypothetical protein
VEGVALSYLTFGWFLSHFTRKVQLLYVRTDTRDEGDINFCLIPSRLAILWYSTVAGELNSAISPTMTDPQGAIDN